MLGIVLQFNKLSLLIADCKIPAFYLFPASACYQHVLKFCDFFGLNASSYKERGIKFEGYNETRFGINR